MQLLPKAWEQYYLHYDFLTIRYGEIINWLLFTSQRGPLITTKLFEHFPPIVFCHRLYIYFFKAAELSVWIEIISVLVHAYMHQKCISPYLWNLQTYFRSPKMYFKKCTCIHMIYRQNTLFYSNRALSAGEPLCLSHCKFGWHLLVIAHICACWGTLVVQVPG